MAVHIFRVGLTGKLLFPEEILSYINFRSTAIYLLKKKKERKKPIYIPKSRNGKKKLYKSRQASLHTTSKSSEGGGVKTIPNFPERPFLWKRYFTLLPSGPNGEQLKSKAMCTKSISKPRSTWQHRYDAFGLLLGPLILF